MGLLDAILGRSKPAPANLDQLFGLSSAKITLEVTEQLVPTGQAGICFKPPTGQSFADTETELSAMLSGEGADQTSAKLSESSDEYGYRWVVVGADDFETLVTRVHFVNSTLKDNGYGQALLCSVIGFTKKAETPAPASTYLVYLFKRGSFYPFVPNGKEGRDNESELRLKNELGDDLHIEPELDRWFPLWNLPVH